MVWRRLIAVRQAASLRAKVLLYGRRGEPYRIGQNVLRYIPGTRPIRLKYTGVKEEVARYDALEVKTLFEHVQAGETIIDIGANAGQYTILMASLVGDQGTVVAFEPDPTALALLQRNISLNPQLKPPTVEDCAMSDKDGDVTFYLDQLSSANSSLSKATFSSKQILERTVRTTTLDDYIRVTGLNPAWVKIDTEGAEIEILRGGQKLLASDAKFLVELHPYAWNDFGDVFEELLFMVQKAGRRIRYLDRDTELTHGPTYGVVMLERLSAELPPMGHIDEQTFSPTKHAAGTW